MDADTGRIVAAELTDHDADDGAQVGPLLDQVDGPIASLTGDGAYDQESVYAGVAERHPEASVVVPPRSTAVPSDTADRADTARPPPAAHRRQGTYGMAESVRRQQTRQDRGHHGQVQRRDRRRAALAHGSASGDRGGGCRPRPQPHAGAGTPGVRPHRMTPNGVGVSAPFPLIHATRPQAELRIE